MSTRHTPGPWEAAMDPLIYPETWGVFAEQAEPGLKMPAECHVPNCEANARLIAAAPELADVLEMALDALANRAGWPDDEPVLDKGYVALRKAGRLA